ncbi:MAG: acyl-CoA dehydrogenase [Bradymonadia bacterium]|jgi:acyl-CoA dehydrogenase
MEFALTEDQASIDELAGKMLTELVTDDSLKALDRDGQWFHAEAWAALADAQLLGLSLPEDVGGTGFGVVELSLLARHAGRVVAPLPLIPMIFGSAWALASYGDDDVRADVLSPLLAGKSFVALALEESNNRNLLAPVTSASEGDKITGSKTGVVMGAESSHAVVSAHGPAGPSLYLVSLAQDGVTQAAQRSTDGTPSSLIEFDGATAIELGGGLNALSQLVERVRLGVCAETLGVCDTAISMTAEYTRTRKQFRVPIGMFQAVKQRIADAYIDRGALEVTTLKAACLIADGGDAGRAVSIASMWAADAGHRVVCAAQHLHGGMGFDRDYAIHRYFLRAKRLEFTFGSAPEHLAELGDRIADDGDGSDEEAL